MTVINITINRRMFFKFDFFREQTRLFRFCFRFLFRNHKPIRNVRTYYITIIGCVSYVPPAINVQPANRKSIYNQWWLVVADEVCAT